MRKLIVLAVLVGIGWFGYKVWPTPYTYQHAKEKTYRTNRLTGSQEVDTTKGWKPVQDKLDVSDRYSEVGIKTFGQESDEKK
jgi:hypothetical protein